MIHLPWLVKTDANTKYWYKIVWKNYKLSSIRNWSNRFSAKIFAWKKCAWRWYKQKKSQSKFVLTSLNHGKQVQLFYKMAFSVWFKNYAPIHPLEDFQFTKTKKVGMGTLKFKAMIPPPLPPNVQGNVQIRCIVVYYKVLIALYDWIKRKKVNVRKWLMVSS